MAVLKTRETEDAIAKEKYPGGYTHSYILLGVSIETFHGCLIYKMRLLSAKRHTRCPVGEVLSNTEYTRLDSISELQTAPHPTHSDGDWSRLRNTAPNGLIGQDSSQALHVPGRA